MFVGLRKYKALLEKYQEIKKRNQSLESLAHYMKYKVDAGTRVFAEQVLQGRREMTFWPDIPPERKMYVFKHKTNGDIALGTDGYPYGWMRDSWDLIGTMPFKEGK